MGRESKCGASSFWDLEDSNNVNEDSSHNDEEESGVNDNGNATISSLPHTTTNDSDSNDNENETKNPDAAKSSAECKTDLVVKLIDNKRKHTERKLSAAQRDAIILEEAREDRMFRRDLTEYLKSSTQVFATALESMSHSVAQMGSAFAQSMGILGMTENMHRFHQPCMNMNLNIQPRQIPGQPQHQQQNNGPFERVYRNLSSNMSPDNNSENNNFYAHLP